MRERERGRVVIFQALVLSILLSTVENTVCILRNLSYRLENEVDPQEGREDILDREWEQEQRREVEDLNRSFSKPSSGCLSFCVRPKTRDDAPRVALTAVNRPVFKCGLCLSWYVHTSLFNPLLTYVMELMTERKHIAKRF